MRLLMPRQLAAGSLIFLIGNILQKHRTLFTLTSYLYHVNFEFLKNRYAHNGCIHKRGKKWMRMDIVILMVDPIM